MLGIRYHQGVFKRSVLYEALSPLPLVSTLVASPLSLLSDFNFLFLPYFACSPFLKIYLEGNPTWTLLFFLQ